MIESVNRSLRNADELHDQAAKATEAVQQPVKVLRNLNGPGGTH
ncbi:hypothetical protein ACH4OY_21250 [Micromonospora rubida]|uniref:Uncharacterized protein n=1 Tax=Micromonospora rubida TaxID=2697657 RepID=A0ABW7SRP9_9ACTN